MSFEDKDKDNDDNLTPSPNPTYDNGLTEEQMQSGRSWLPNDPHFAELENKDNGNRVIFTELPCQNELCGNKDIKQYPVPGILYGDYVHDIIGFKCTNCGSACKDFPSFSVNANWKGFDNGNGESKLNVNAPITTTVEAPADIANKEYFEFIVNTTKKTVRQEDALIRQILYTGFSAFTDDPINLAIMAPTSEGKTYPIMETFQYFPNDTVWNIGKMSKMVLVRQKGILVDSNTGQPIEPRVLQLKQQISNEEDKNKVVELKEQLSKLRSDATHLIDLRGKILVFLEPPQPDLMDLIKPILSHDKEEITFDYVNTDRPTSSEGSRVQKVIVRGWPACIFCSAKDESNWPTWPEIQSRFLITSPNMTKEKYEESNLLIAQRKGLPSFIQDQVIVSEHDIKSSKQCVNYLIENLKTVKNNVWIPYSDILAESLKAEKGTDVRNTKRIFSLLTIIPLVKSDARQRLSINGNTSIIATLEDLSEVLAITQNLNGLPTYKMKFFKQVFYPKFASKIEPDKSSDGKKEEDTIAVTTKELVQECKVKLGKTYTTDSLKKVYLNELHNNGILEEEESKVDGRQKIYRPLISLDEDEKISNYTNLTQFDNFLYHSPILLPRNCKLPAENWLILEILTFLKYRIDKTSNDLIQLEDIQITTPYGTELSIKEFISKYENTSRNLIRYFKKANYRNYHNEIFGDMNYLNGEPKKM